MNDQDSPQDSRRDSGPDEEKDEQAGGQVSEVASMDPDAADTPISDDQAVAGYPDSESGRPEEGETGPNAVPAGNIRDVHGDDDAVEGAE